jgi:hypothetical protein
MRKHLLVFFQNGQLVQTQPRISARENMRHFPNHNFRTQDDHPTTEVIEAYLMQNHAFQRLENNDIVVCYNLDRNLNL